MRKITTLILLTLASVAIVFGVITIRNNRNENNATISNDADKIQVIQDKGETNDVNKQQIINRLKSLGY